MWACTEACPRSLELAIGGSTHIDMMARKLLATAAVIARQIGEVP